jgi:hypothetical protein
MLGNTIHSHERALEIQKESRELREAARTTVEHAKAAIDRAKRLLNECQRKVASAAPPPQPMNVRETRVPVA